MILLTGAAGFVGQAILRSRDDVIPCPSLRDVTAEEVRRIVAQSGADTIIHTAAISDIGTCEADPEASFRANVLLPVYLTQAAEGVKLICFSSDQVYSGRPEAGPYTEDAVCPANTYARHKLEMEQRVLDISPDAVMLRAEWMYGYYEKKGNYLMNILGAKEKISFSSQQYRGITYVKDVARTMDAVMALPGGVYNFGSETTKSMYAITRDFLHLIGKQIDLEDGPARHNLWMNCEKARLLGVDFPSVEEGLKACAIDHQLIK